MTTDEYERLLYNIVQGFQQDHPDLSELELKYGKKNKIRGASGYEHQIDVSLKDSRHLFIVECKRWYSRPIGVAEVLVLASRTRDIQGPRSSCKVESILASLKSATSGASISANHFGISVEVVKSEQEFGLRLGSIGHHANVDQLGMGDKVFNTLGRNGRVMDDLPATSKQGDD